MQGESLVPLLTGQVSQLKRKALYYHYYEYPAEHMVNRHYALINKDYKLIHYYYAVDEWELIDRKKDPYELKNVYQDPAYTQVRKKLHRELDALRVKYKDNDQISAQYIDRFLGDAAQGKVFGLSSEKAGKMQRERRKK